MLGSLLSMSLGWRLTMGLWVNRFTLLPSNMGVTSAALLRIMWKRLLLSTHHLLLLLSYSQLRLLLALVAMVAAGGALLLTCSRTTA